MQHTDNLNKKTHLSPSIIAGIYLVIGLIWILVTDQWASGIIEANDFGSWLHTAKGVLYVVITAGLLHGLIKLYTRRITRSNRQLQAIVNSSPVGILKLDPELHVTDLWSPKAESLLGIPLNQVRGSIPPLFSGENKPLVTDKLDELKKGKTVSNIELSYTDNMGKMRWFSVSITPLMNRETGKLGELLTVISEITSIKEYQTQLTRSLKEKEILLQEVHHRVKNNLAIVTGLLDMQSDQSENSAISEALETSKSRIQSMALVHEVVYESENFYGVRMHEIVDTLLQHIQNNFKYSNSLVTINKNIDEIFLELEKAIPTSMILNEILVNTFQHASKTNRSCGLNLDVSIRDDKLTIAIQDNAECFPTEFSEHKADTLGTMLINDLARQLKADMKMTTGEEGNKIFITFSYKRELKSASIKPV